MAWPVLPKRIEHALKALICLAQTRDRPIRAHEVARCVHITPSQAARTLYFLVWAGLAQSQRGSTGGFWLARSPDRVRVEQVMKFFERRTERAAGVSSDPLLKAWRETAETQLQSCTKLSIADLLRRTLRNKEVSPYICPHTGHPIYAP